MSEPNIDALVSFVKMCGRIADQSGRTVEEVARIIVVFQASQKPVDEKTLTDLLKQAKSAH